MERFWKQFKPRRPGEIPAAEVAKLAEDLGYKLGDPGAELALRNAIAFSDQLAQDPQIQAMFAAREHPQTKHFILWIF